MSKGTFDLTPAVINWISEQVRDDADGSIQTTLHKWASGEQKPTFNQIEKVSKQIRMPFGYFFLQEPPVEDSRILEYRTVESLKLQNPSRELMDTISSMEAVQDWMRDYQIQQGYSEIDIVSSLKDSTDIQYNTDVIRHDLDIKADWICSQRDAWEAFKYLRKKLEALGIIIMLNGVVGQNTHRSLNVEEFRAFTLLDEYAPLIFVNSSDSKNGKLFSLIHEAAHVWLGSDSFYNDRYGDARHVSALENICNAIAAEIIVPDDLFTTEWNRQDKAVGHISKVTELAGIFNCSETVIARRALNNHFISEFEYNKISEQAISNYKIMQGRKSSGGDFYKNLAVKNDRRLIKALNSSIYEGKTPFTEAYRLTNTNRKTFSELVDKTRGIR